MARTRHTGKYAAYAVRDPRVGCGKKSALAGALCLYVPAGAEQAAIERVSRLPGILKVGICLSEGIEDCLSNEALFDREADELVRMNIP